MSWKIELKPSAEKQYLKLDRKTRKRIKDALIELEKENNPFLHRSMRPLTGQLRGDYRLRVGEWRVLLTPDAGKNFLYAYAVLPRGRAY